MFHILLLRYDSTAVRQCLGEGEMFHILLLRYDSTAVRQCLGEFAFCRGTIVRQCNTLCK